MGLTLSSMKSETPSKHDDYATPGPPESAWIQAAENAMSEPPMTPSDVGLVDAARGGDRDAFETLVDRHYDMMFWVSFQELDGDIDETRDQMQDLCMALPVKLESFGGRSKFTTWLHRVAVNAARDRLRRIKARREEQPEPAEPAADNDPADGGQLERTEELDWAKSLLKRLPKEMRDTFCLVDVLDFKQKEAAEILGVAKGTVAWRMHQARKRLKVWTTLEKERVS